MKTEHSCGAVVFTRQGGALRYAILHSVNGDWGFPKGHIEPGETEKKTALREIKEELGLQVTLLDGFREEITYLMPNQIYKHCVYFLGTYADQELRCQESEVAGAELMAFPQAMDTLEFEGLKEILRRANAFLCSE